MTPTALALLAFAALAAPSSEPLEVGAQGVFQPRRASPLGTWRLEVAPRRGDFTHVESDLTLVGASGARHALPDVVGTGFLVSELGQVVVTTATHADHVPVHLAVLDRVGRVRYAEELVGLTGPRLSRDGDQVGLRTRGDVRVLDLTTFQVTRHPRLGVFAVGDEGQVAGVPIGTSDVVLSEGGERWRVTLPAPARVLAFDAAGDVWAVTARALYRLRGGTALARFHAPEGSDLRDLYVASERVHLGLRRVEGARTFGRHVVLDPTGRAGETLDLSVGPAPPAAPTGAGKVGAILWPLAPNTQHPIGNTYAEFQEYSNGNEYLHPGVDVLGSDGQPVYAVADGVVKAVLTTSGQWHWRVATGDAGAGTSTGYLYAHLDLPTIAVNVGDTVVAGQYLGDLVPWPVASFTHCHFARIEDTGTQWFGDWLCTDNPHLDFEGLTETQAPVFENARGGDLFAFPTNETSSYQNKNDLHGEVDVVVHVGDRLNSGWTCSVQRLRYSIWPAGDPGAPVVDNRLAVEFDMHLDTYQDGPFDPLLVELLYKEDSTCNTNGDYGSREFFHVITNSDGDDVYEAADADEAWDTTAVANGSYVIEVTAWDAAGNSATAAMTVTVDN